MAAADGGKPPAGGKRTGGVAPAGAAAAKGSAAVTEVSPHRRFFRRVISGAKVAAYLLAATLLIGVIGYHTIAGLSWLVSFQQASLLLAGMGPVITDLPDGARVFESVYALFCGVMLLGSTGILFTPFIHRMLHAFHVEDMGSGGKDG